MAQGQSRPMLPPAQPCCSAHKKAGMNGGSTHVEVVGVLGCRTHVLELFLQHHNGTRQVLSTDWQTLAQPVGMCASSAVWH